MTLAGMKALTNTYRSAETSRPANSETPQKGKENKR